MNIFQIIRMLVNKQITNEYGNSKFTNDGQDWTEYTVYQNPKFAVKWLKENGIADVEIKRKQTYYGCEYTIKLKDYNLDTEFFKREKKRTIPVSKLQSWYDEHRPDDDRTYSQSRVDDEYYHQDETLYEKLALEDNCTFEMFLQSLGYNSYKDFLLKHENDTKEFREIIDEKYKEFLEKNTAKDYEI